MATVETMNVHRALIELKTIGSRIEGGISRNSFAFANKHSNNKVQGVDLKVVTENIKDVYKQVTDLIKRRDALKRAVVNSNAKTSVEIGGVQYTVAEAIEMKNNGIPVMRSLLNKLEMDYRRAQTDCERENGDRLEARANAHIESMYGKTDAKGVTEEMRRDRESFLASQVYEVVDPIGIAAKIAELRDYISNFMVEVDAALSVSNSTTEITIEY